MSEKSEQSLVIGNYTHLITAIDFLNGQIAMLLRRAEEMDKNGGNSLSLRSDCLELSTAVNVLEFHVRENNKTLKSN